MYLFVYIVHHTHIPDTFWFQPLIVKSCCFPLFYLCKCFFLWPVGTKHNI